jgi:uncharacterized protein YegL
MVRNLTVRARIFPYHIKQVVCSSGTGKQNYLSVSRQQIRGKKHLERQADPSGRSIFSQLFEGWLSTSIAASLSRSGEKNHWLPTLHQSSSHKGLFWNL